LQLDLTAARQRSVTATDESKKREKTVEISEIKLSKPQGTRDGAIISVTLASARHQFTLRDHGYGVSASSRGVSVYVPAFAGTQYSCATEGWPG